MSNMTQLILAFAKIGTFSFGGGYAMIPFLREETVAVHHWITSARLLDLVAISQSTPGPIIVNLATFIGYQQGGGLGSLAATMAVTLPSFTLSCLLWQIKRRGAGLPGLDAAFAGIRPAAVGLIAGVCITMGAEVMKNPLQVIICLGVFALSAKTKVKTAVLLITSALLGIGAASLGLTGGML